MFTSQQAIDLWGEDHLRLLLRKGILRRVLRGIYADAADDDPWLVHRAALMLAPRRSALAGRSAAALLTTMVDIPAVPELIVPRQLRVAGIRAQRTLVPDDLLTQRLGLVSTSADLTAAQCARTLPRIEAVVTMDRLLRRGGATQLGIGRLLDGGGRGSARGRLHLAETEPLSDSPSETRLRLVLTDGGLPRPVAQCRVDDDGGAFIAYLDLGWPEARAGEEYLGDVHLTRRQAAVDRSRRRAVDRHTDWEVQEVGAPEMQNPRRVVADVEEMLGRRCPRLLGR